MTIFPKFKSTAFMPVIIRELRASSHNPFTYWLRVIAGAVGVLAFYLAMEKSSDTSSAEASASIFLLLHLALVIVLAIWAPISTSDCIAREKREGTLGLLFLTELNDKGIVVGKALIQIIRGLVVWLSVIPILAIPLLLGGLQVIDICSAVFMEACVALLGIASGLIATVKCKNRKTAMILAFAIFLGFALLFMGIILLLWMPFWPPRVITSIQEHPLMWFLPPIFAITSFGGGELLSKVLTAIGPSQGTWLGLLFVFVGFCLLMLWFSIRFAATRLRKNWREKPTSPRVAKLEKRFCTPLFQRRYKRRMSGMLNWNPVAWLVLHSWKPRLLALLLSLLVVVVIGLCTIIVGDDNFRALMTPLHWILMLMLVTYLYAGVSSFQDEKKSGGLELLLITPMSASRIIWGRAIGLWAQFIIAMVVYLGFYIPVFYATQSFGFPTIPVMATSFIFLSLPFFATYAALRIRNTFLASIIALLMALVMLFYAKTFDDVLERNFHNDAIRLFICFTLASTSMVGVTFFLLRHSLRRRIYSF
jgi:ABC-type Na+ efflux pump permease subunit